VLHAITKHKISKLCNWIALRLSISNAIFLSEILEIKSGTGMEYIIISGKSQLFFAPKIPN